MNERKSRTAGQVVSGALILGLATVVSKVIGTLQKIPLQNMGGDGVFGIYNAVYPFYVLLVVVASAGIPVAVARLVAECEAAGDERGSRQVLHASCALMSVTGLIGFAAMMSGAEAMGGWIGNRHTVPAIQSSAYALLVMPLAAALRGYNQGRGEMNSTAVSQVIEQTGRVTVMIALLLYYTSHGAADETVAAGATFGSFAGGVCGLLTMGIYWWIEHRKRPNRMARQRKDTFAAATDEAVTVHSVQQGGRQRPDSAVVQDGPASRRQGGGSPTLWTMMRRLAWTALPICLGAIVMPAVNVVDVFTVPRLLLEQGLSEAGALAQFGIYSRAFPLVQLVTMVAGSLAVGLVPTVAETVRRQDEPQLRTIIQAAQRWAWLLGLAATAGLIALAEPINVALYTDNAGWTAFVLVASTAVSGVFQAVTAALMQGMGAVRAPALHLLAAACVKAALNVWLVPAYGIAGAATSAAAALALAAALNALALARASGVGIAAWGAR
ncbi:polysaccharide biosynthesis protein, partial [Paenibacillus apiarius]